MCRILTVVLSGSTASNLLELSLNEPSKNIFTRGTRCIGYLYCSSDGSTASNLEKVYYTQRHSPRIKAKRRQGVYGSSVVRLYRPLHTLLFLKWFIQEGSRRFDALHHI